MKGRAYDWIIWDFGYETNIRSNHCHFLVMIVWQLMLKHLNTQKRYFIGWWKASLKSSGLFFMDMPFKKYGNLQHDRSIIFGSEWGSYILFEKCKRDDSRQTKRHRTMAAHASEYKACPMFGKHHKGDKSKPH